MKFFWILITIFCGHFQEGAFALAFKSKHFPGECVATRRGSPLLVGIKTKTRLATDHIPILYGKGESERENCGVSKSRWK
jgi:glucosamine 6-phosphate synthetase-like amidotransferase/phosphosugar isomerase protein